MSNPPVHVTRPFLPPLEEFIPYLEEIWTSGHLTNGGPMHQRLEAALCEYLGVPHLCLFNNGTSALMVALQALELQGEVITTPYSFVATANAIAWNGLDPVFVDVEPTYLNLSPEAIEAAITENTSAIVPVHCYGNPCDTAAIDAIARRHGLKVVYDAAHAFGVRDSEGSILRHGDLAVLSFHATKVFNTFEGGAVVCHDLEMKQRLDRLKNFGLDGESRLAATGMNGKLNEVSAAFGLLQLKHIDTALEARKKIDTHFRLALEKLPGLSALPRGRQTNDNFSYFPVLVEPSYPLSRDELLTCLAERGIHGRRYFHPLIPDFEHSPFRGGDWPVARDASDRVLCLPIYPGLSSDELDRIVYALREAR
ncbi:MAG: DegT/DnrJ/EryC1/StrS family aminotransferase [Alcanivorax sp.]|uniref:DegT/DnrJ/EryC1/StrS family aminotransferase n=1 Tax=Alloalcanivorax marinus TaxID=1177169 RepID=UPI00195AE190|nr:DegT/DnrJ/EryC1/StrS family aminotransferase [Alloalcanivorax marinus]MBM7332991.1 DegT/DnrJ/EryC1/StrS family aminotransferase [Alloalcanivorax marinus]